MNRRFKEHILKKSGMTLIELMIVIVVLMIIAVVMLPVLTGSSARDEAIKAMDKLVDEIDFGRFNAMLTNRAIRLRIVGKDEFHFDRSANTSCCCPGADDPFDPSKGGELDVKVFSIKNDIGPFKIAQTDPAELLTGGTSICFTPDGRVLNTQTLTPFVSTLFGYGNGIAVIRLQMLELISGGSNPKYGNPIPGFSYRVIIPYNGIVRWEAK